MHMGITYRSSNTYCTAYAMTYCSGNTYWFHGEAYQSTNMYFCAYAMTYCSVHTYCCLFGKRIGRPIRIAALTPWYIVLAIQITAFEASVSVDHYVAQCLRRDILFWRYILLPFRRMYRSTNTYFCDYAMTCYSGNMYLTSTGQTYRSTNAYCYALMTYYSRNTYVCLWVKRVGRPIRIAALTPWHIVMKIYIIAFGTNVSFDQYVVQGLHHNILFCQYILMPMGLRYRSTNTYCTAYAITNLSGNTYWFHGANVSVDQYVFLRWHHDIMFCR